MAEDWEKALGRFALAPLALLERREMHRRPARGRRAGIEAQQVAVAQIVEDAEKSAPEAQKPCRVHGRRRRSGRGPGPLDRGGGAREDSLSG